MPAISWLLLCLAVLLDVAASSCHAQVNWDWRTNLLQFFFCLLLLAHADWLLARCNCSSSSSRVRTHLRFQCSVCAENKMSPLSGKREGKKKPVCLRGACSFFLERLNLKEERPRRDLVLVLTFLLLSCNILTPNQVAENWGWHFNGRGRF